jgi:hypothetical protein
MVRDNNICYYRYYKRVRISYTLCLNVGVSYDFLILILEYFERRSMLSVIEL